MIVVEGPDGAGKTTLIAALSKEFQLPIAPRVVAKDTTAMVDLVKWVEENNAKPWERLLYDRHRLISETIYGPILNRSAPGFDDIYWLGPQINRFYQKRPCIIYCLPPKEEVYKNIHQDDTNKEVSPHWEQIYNMYVSRMALDFPKPNVFWYNYAVNWSYDAIVSALKGALRNAGYR
jgi:hypothetical protein